MIFDANPSASALRVMVQTQHAALYGFVLSLVARTTRIVVRVAECCSEGLLRSQRGTLHNGADLLHVLNYGIRGSSRVFFTYVINEEAICFSGSPRCANAHAYALAYVLRLCAESILQRLVPSSLAISCRSTRCMRMLQSMFILLEVTQNHCTARLTRLFVCVGVDSNAEFHVREVETEGTKKFALVLDNNSGTYSPDRVCIHTRPYITLTLCVLCVQSLWQLCVRWSYFSHSEFVAESSRTFH